MKWGEKEALTALDLNYKWFIKFCNSFLKCPELYELLFFHRLRRKNTTEYWKNRMETGKRGISNYIDLSPTSYPLLEEIKKRAGDDNEIPILELACNCGRHINNLHQAGYTNLHGVDVNYGCDSVMKREFQDLYQNVKSNWESFEMYLPKVPDNSFGIVFTHGKTIEHVNPRFPLVKHIARICSKYIILGNVGFSHGSYPRFWNYEFSKNGFSLIKLLQPEKEWAPDSQVNRPHSLAVYKKR